MTGPRAGVALTLHNLTVTYGRVPALHHLSGQFDAGSLTAVTGPNGAGKSSLLRAVMGFVPLAEGRIDRGGIASRAIAYLPQAHEIDRSFPITISDFIALGFWKQTGAFGGLSDVQLGKVQEAMAALGLDGLEAVPIQRLSSGQFQRVLFARLLLAESPLVLLDEPFASLDESTVEALLRVVQDWHRQGRTIIAVIHDHRQILSQFPHTLLLARECVAWGPTANVLTAENLERAQALTRVWTRESGRQHVERG